jgi:diadenylate cyclase
MNPEIGIEVGTRHRAAIGLTEETDAVAIVVSEEKAWISLVVDGQVTTGLDGVALRKLLLRYLQPQQSPLRRLWAQWMRPRPEQA